MVIVLSESFNIFDWLIRVNVNNLGLVQSCNFNFETTVTIQPTTQSHTGTVGVEEHLRRGIQIYGTDEH